MHRFQKFFFPNDYKRPITHFFSKSISGPVQVRPCTYLRGRIELFQVSLIGFQKFFMFWVAGMILDAWDVELESANSFMYHVYF